MESLQVKLKYADAVKIVLKSLWLPVLMTLGLIAYQGNLSTDNLSFLLLLLFGACLATSLIVYSVPYLTLTESGMNFKNWRGRDLFCSWEANISIKPGKLGSLPVYAFEPAESGKTHNIPRILFSYQEVNEFIASHAPATHELKHLVE